MTDNWTEAANNAADAFRSFMEAAKVLDGYSDALDKFKKTAAHMMFYFSEFSPGQSLEEVQEEYRERVFSAMQDYLESDKPITAYKNDFKQAINDAFTFAFIAGWADAGASALTDEAQSWLNGRIGEELGYLDSLFAQLKALRDDKDLTGEEKLDAAEAHADGYSQTLNAVYSQGVLMGNPEMDLTFEGDDGSADSICQSIGGTCVKLKGQTHPASWWIENQLIPGPGNSNYDCGGWECRHHLVDKNGKVWAGFASQSVFEFSGGTTPQRAVTF